MNNKEIKYKTVDVSGMTNRSQRELEIFKYLEPYHSVKIQSYVGNGKRAFSKEVAIDVLFEYFYNDKDAKDIAKEYEAEEVIDFGMTHGVTRVFCGFNTGKGKLGQSGLDQEKAKAIIAEAVEFAYE